MQKIINPRHRAGHVTSVYIYIWLEVGTTTMNFFSLSLSNKKTSQILGLNNNIQVSILNLHNMEK